uniref:Putative glycine receptor alpha 3 n=1 Tax=Rhipicephalus pulchellus TaxID=72859 RepID=L7M4K6_RHIPC
MRWQDHGRKDSTFRWLLLCASCLAVQLLCGVLPAARAVEAGSSTGVAGSSSEVYLSSVERESDSPATSDAPATSAETPGGDDPLVPAPRLAFLDKMLEQYDKRAWPTYGMGHPTYVKVNIYVNSIGPVNANNMEYGMDIYLRQSWQDLRLNVSKYGVNSTVTINGEDIMGKIWKPDLFFRNVKEASFHYVTVPNKLVKLGPDGEVLFSMRLTLRLACFMSFRHFPLDTQRCHILLGPYAQTIEQTAISWQDTDPIVLERPIEIPEFDLVHNSYGHYNRAIDTGVFSFLNATFTLERQNGYHLIQTYLPTFLIVMISWVSFWLNVDATPARVTLGVTTLLTMTTVASGVRTQLPPVSYIKAIDVWIGACSVMVFGALLEFTLVNYLSRSKLRPEEFRKSINIFHRNRKSGEKPDGEEGPNKYETRGHMELQKNLKRSQNVDKVCRIMFPFVFFVFNVVYWFYYLYMSEFT